MGPRSQAVENGEARGSGQLALRTVSPWVTCAIVKRFDATPAVIQIVNQHRLGAALWAIQVVSRGQPNVHKEFPLKIDVNHAGPSRLAEPPYPSLSYTGDRGTYLSNSCRISSIDR